MNEYQVKQKSISADLFTLAEKLAFYMGVGWEVQPPDRTHDYAPRQHYIDNGKYELCVSYVEWDNQKRLEVTAIGWPKYRDKDGGTKRTYPSNLGKEWRNDDFVDRRTRPSCTARADRDMAAIARHVKNTVMPSYIEIYAELEDYAADQEAYANKERHGFTLVAKACRATDGKIPYYVSPVSGGAVRVVYQSRDSVQLTLTAEQAAATIEWLRDQEAPHV